jgi:CubicO group peptidase (beta-lactamase class C family)
MVGETHVVGEAVLADIIEQATTHYFPGTDPDWERQDPDDAGFEPGRLDAAVAYAIASETDWDDDILDHLRNGHFEPSPYNEIIGPTRERGKPSGLILKSGRIVAEWGDTRRVDMTFSASKSYVSTCVGLAYDRGMIPDLHAPVRELVDDGGFEPPHNHRITWHHLLQQTSEWEGTLWDKPDMIDRHRDLDNALNNPLKGTHRALAEPGDFWEYNDVRVNRLSLAAMQVWRRPLPEVLKELVMDPIGASQSWEWHGYKNSYVTIDGREMQSVSGGGHWGGGMFISSFDHARFGYLLLRRGAWAGRRLISEHWIDRAITPCERNRAYGYMWWLNRDGLSAPSAPESSFFARGAGANIVWVDPDNDIVAVTRWITKDKFDGFARRVLAALR